MSIGQPKYNHHMSSNEPLRLTRAQVREIDRRAIEEYHIPGIVLMENAARGAADVAMQMLAGVESPSVLIVCGGGNNGGDGLAVARHLQNRGVVVEIATAWTELKGDALANWRIVEAMKLPTTSIHDADIPIFGEHVDLIIDALFGTGLTRPIEGFIADFIDRIINASGRPVLAIDVPSGLDCDTGEPLGPCVRATRTVTFIDEKAGFANPVSKQYTGQVTVADIGCPRELIEEVSARR
jgi:NAD(P)H-hydrate epimerase